MIELARIGWKDEPSEDTPIDSGNLKAMENNTENFVRQMSYAGTEKGRLIIDSTTVTSVTEAGATITIPLSYKVGIGALDVYLKGERLIACTGTDETTGSYLEVGTADSISNQIKLTSDWKLEVGDYLEFITRGEWS